MQDTQDIKYTLTGNAMQENLITLLLYQLKSVRLQSLDNFEIID